MMAYYLYKLEVIRYNKFKNVLSSLLGYTKTKPNLFFRKNFILDISDINGHFLGSRLDYVKC